MVIQKPCCPNVMKQLHVDHPGMNRMKALTRSYVWWPKMDMELEDMVRKCGTCQDSQRMPPSALVHPWEYPDRAWSIVHIDYARPFMAKIFFV